MKVAKMCFIAGSMGAGLASGAAAQSATITWMRVAEHVDVNDIADSVYDQGFTTATNALVVDEDGSATEDVSCNISLVRESTWWFSGGGSDSDVDTQTEYTNTAFNGADGFINVVNNIDWCGRMLMMPVGGCGWPEGSYWPPIVAVSNAGAGNGLNGFTFAHEYGHATGNMHNGSGSVRLMSDALLAATNTRVDATECAKLRFDGWGPTCPSDNSGFYPVICDWEESSLRASGSAPPDFTRTGAAQARVEDDYTGVPIRELARRTMFEHSPAEVEDFYGPADVAVLKQMLSDPSQQGNRRMVLALIGLISKGSDADVNVLVDLVRAQGSDLRGASLALGAIAARTSNKRGVRVLLELFASAELRVARAVAAGLAVSGDPRALAALEADPRKREDGSLWFRDFADENRRVAKLGLRGYYREPSLAVPRLPERLASARAGKRE